MVFELVVCVPQSRVHRHWSIWKMKGAIDDLKEVSFKNVLRWYSDGNLDLCKRTSYDSPKL